MKELEVRSRIISSVFFDPRDGKLYILFKNGEKRLFDKVSERAATEMVNAPSPGRYYLEHIRTAIGVSPPERRFQTLRQPCARAE